MHRVKTKPINHRFGFILALALCALGYCTACRGREFAKPMPPLKETAAETLLVFQSDEQDNFSGARVHFVDPASGTGSELSKIKAEGVSELLKEPHLTYGRYLITNRGKYAEMLSAEERASSRPDAHTSSLLSPDKKYYLRAGFGKVAIALTNGSAEEARREDWANCGWRDATRIICLQGKYQERRQIIEYDVASRQRKVLHEVAGKIKLENLCLSPDRKIAAFTAGINDKVAILILDLKSGEKKQIADFQERYIFALAVTIEGIVAARIVNSKHSEDKLEPYDIWISAPFGGLPAAGYLLRLPALDSPGFVSGKGYRGVESMSFSPDGKKLAFLMSGENDCRMADEGGNLACRHDIYVVERDSPGVRRLTQFQIQSAKVLHWLKFDK